MGRADVRYPIPNRLIDGIFERFAPAGNRNDLRAEQFHPLHVGQLAGNVHLAHVDDTFEAEQGASGGGADTMLPRACFGDDALFAHPLGEQCLAEGVVDFVRSGVIEVFALEINLRPTQLFGQSAGVGNGRRPPDIRLQEMIELCPKIGVLLDGGISGRQLL